MRKFLVCVALGLACLSLQAQTAVHVGARVFPSAGLEAGISFGNRIGIKAISQCDWYRTGMFKYDHDEIIGKTYRLMYGGGLSVRLAGNFWFSLDVGYGWRGKYLYESESGSLAVSEQVKGLDVGADIRWNFSDNWYLMAGYETIPDGFKLNRPVHEVVLGFGVSLPL